MINRIFYSNEIYIAVGGFSGMFVVLNYLGQELYKNIFSDSIQCTPVVSKCQNFILIGCFNGSVYCIDYLRNTTVWEFLTGGPVVNSPCYCKNESAVVFGSYDKYIYCISNKVSIYQCF